MRLGVWSRVAIVFSVIWMLGAPAYLTSKELSEWQSRTTNMYELCLRLGRDMPVDKMGSFYERCANDSQRSSDAMIAARWSLFRGSVGLSFAALIAAWLVGVVMYGTARWILAGRKNIR